ncbi:MAG: hypothetical protein M1821_005078 [Bathelium mastoideum]|nr:MAG: hypothetical protein M1821_005078 [Bathelium mastoideum]
MVEPEPHVRVEQPSSQSAPRAPASSYAHTKGLMGPPEMKPSQKSSSGSQIVSQTQFEDGDPADGQDQLHASRPSTPEEQMDSAVDPSEPLEKFDWYDLEVRYHDMIKDRDAVEQQLLQDFDHLSQVG